MAEHEQDKDVSRRYRELGHDEPPLALDAKIRAEARSALETHAAPLVAPTGRNRWYFPLAAAAVIMLAVAVTSQVEREQPEVAAISESISGAKEAPKNEATPEAKPLERRMEGQDRFAARRDAPRAAAPEKPASPPQFTPEPDLQAGTRAKKQAEVAAAPAPPQVKDELAKRQIETPRAEERQRDQAASVPEATAEEKLRRTEPLAQAAQAKPAARAPSPSANLDLRGAGVVGALAFQDAPEPWLERIAKLRAEGKHDEADKALAEFRKRYPDYKIPPAMLEKVERKSESGR